MRLTGIANIDWDKMGPMKEHFASFIGSLYRPPDLIIADEDGKPYLYRWWIIPRNEYTNVYAHIQVDNDPARPLHDHPWDNTSVILFGGYREIFTLSPWLPHQPQEVIRAPGDVVHRKATTAHRLLLRPTVPYSASIFTTGPKAKEWGFWHKREFHPHGDWNKLKDGTSFWTGPKVEDNGQANSV
jgi:hypothetical protein